MVCFATCLTGWINSFWLLFGSVTVFIVVVVFIVVDFGVWFRVIGATVFVSRVVLSFFSLLLLFFQQATLVSVLSWVCTVVARWFGSVGITVCGLLAHSVLL